MGKNRKEIAIVAKSAWPMRLTQKGIIHSIICDAIGIGALCVSANLEVPLQPVPFTLQVLALAFIVAAFDVREAAVTTAGYVVIGALGAPFVVLDLMKAGIASCLTAAARIAMGKDMH
jgi:biotin transporter BioY